MKSNIWMMYLGEYNNLYPIFYILYSVFVKCYFTNYFTLLKSSPVDGRKKAGRLLRLQAELRSHHRTLS